MKLLIKTICLITILSGHTLLYSQTNWVLNYNSFLENVKSTNPLAIKSENNRAYGIAQFKAAQGFFDPQINSSYNNKFYNSGRYYTFGTAEIKQPLYTSQYIKMGYMYGQGPYLNPENLTHPRGMPFIGVEASLLQGLLFDKRRAEIKKARHYIEYYDAERKILLNDLLFISSNTYFEYLYTQKIKDLNSYFTALAVQRLRAIQELSAIGEKASVDTIEASIFLQGRLLERQAAELDLNNVSNKISALIQSAPSNVDTKFIITDSLGNIFNLVKKNMDQSLSDDVTNNPIIVQYTTKQKILETELKLKKELMKPVLDVGYNFLNNGSADFSTNYINNYKWSATFSFPIFLRKSRWEYKMASIDVNNNEQDLVNKQNQLRFKRNYILEAIKITTQQIVNASKSSSYSKLLVEAEKLKFDNGESSLFLLNAREAKWLDAELKLAELKLKYIKNYLELVFLTGSLNYSFL